MKRLYYIVFPGKFFEVLLVTNAYIKTVYANGSRAKKISFSTAAKEVFLEKLLLSLSIRACRREQLLYLFVPIASISSMKTMDGACSSATRNSSRTSFGPSPRYFWMSSEPTTRRKVADVWFATALASKVLPIFSGKEKL